MVANNHIDTVSTGTASTYGLRVSNSGNVTATGNHISSVKLGIFYSGSSTGKYMGNLTSAVATPFTGGTAVGIND